MRFLIYFWFMGLTANFLLWRLTRYSTRRIWHWTHRLAAIQLAGVVVAPLLLGAFGYWYTHRPVPDSVQQTLYEGVTYIRDVRSEPRPIITHFVLIDLDTEGLEFLVTPGQATDGQEVEAQRTSDFLQEYDLQIAINGDFFEPWDPRTPLNNGQPLDVKGYASSEGLIYSRGYALQPRPTLFISRDNVAQFSEPAGAVYNAISGDYIFMVDGELQADGLRWPYHFRPNPRTAVALDASQRVLMLVVVDGRQPNYSEGVSLEELADIITQYGGVTALNLDGGGSATLVATNQQGRPLTLNSPIDNRIPGRERPVANHLGLAVQGAAPPDVAQTPDE